MSNNSSATQFPLSEKFINAVKTGQLPAYTSDIAPLDAALSNSEVIDLFETQVMSRHLDFQSRVMQKQGKSFYTIGSSGHEGNAAVAAALRFNDMAFLHYRSGAFMIQRSKQVAGQTPLYDMMLSFAASSEDPISGGRHKVLGSQSLYIPPQTSTIASHLPKAVGTAFSVGLSNKLGHIGKLARDSVVLCSFGDASANHSTAQGAINAAAWASYQSAPLPIIFLCEDNGIGISTSTPNGWIEANFSHRPGLNYLQCDGLNLLDTYQTTQHAIHIARKRHQPVFLHMKLVRLLGHAGSDTESAYRTKQSIADDESQDPLMHNASLLIHHRVLRPDQIIDLYQSIADRVERISEIACNRPRLENAKQVMQSIDPPTVKANTLPPALTDKRRASLFKHEKHNIAKKQHMAKLINWALHDLMASYDNTVLCGEDIARKGGVYNVTSHLCEAFGPARVINTLLDEQSILGLAIGLAHNGFLPIPEIQFLAYVHNAEDQIRGEAATLPFFSNGQFTNPMVIRIAGLAYQKGFGGHFHNDNSFAVFRDIPGVIIACPSNGADAADMLRTCVELANKEQRLVIFIEPIALYMQKDLHEVGDGKWCFDYPLPSQPLSMSLGDIGVHGNGQKLAIVSYGNGYYLSRKAEKLLAEQGIECRVIDLRWLAPLNEKAIIEAVSSCEHILIVDECRKTGSISEALITLFAENLQSQSMRRITAEDCFIPLGSASYLVLPSVEQIIDTALMMTQGEPE
jgi:2-oxoisovalerate dehydrogenase E1 component